MPPERREKFLGNIQAEAGRLQASIERLLALSAFRIEALFGDFKRGPFVAGGEQVWLARPR